MNKAYTLITVKDIDDGKGIIKGITSDITPDRVHDIVEPKGAKYKLPLPLLSQHAHHLPLGLITTADVTDKHIEIEAELSLDAGLEYIETAWKQIKAKLVRGLSIGYRGIEYAFLDNGGIHYKEWEWLESSAVTVPAHQNATITSVKAFDTDPEKRAIAVSTMSGANAAVERALAMRKQLGINS
jgi:HK97 family phage prohead protease